METTEVEKCATGPDDTNQLNRNRSFKSKQLVRSQALRETHSPPRALSPAQPTPVVTISAITVANSDITVANSDITVANSTAAPIVDYNTTTSVNTASNVDNVIENGTSNIDNASSNTSTSSVENSPLTAVNSPLTAVNSPLTAVNSPLTAVNLPLTVINSSPSSVNSPPSAINSSGMSPTVASFTPTAGYSGGSTSNERTVSVSDDSSHVSVRCSDVVNSSDVKHSDSDDFKKKLPVEIQITSGSWDDTHHERYRPRRWHSDAPRDLLSNNPRVSCVCGYCAACVHCKGRRRRPATKQDSGIVCPDDDPSDNDAGASCSNEPMRKASSLDVDDQPYYCRCPERKEPKPRPLHRYEYYDDRGIYEPTVPELVAFIKDTLNKNMRDRMALFKIEKELNSLVNDMGRYLVRFPVMTSYGRMLVHRCASLFQLSHHLDLNTKTAVTVSKSGTSGGRIPCTSFKEWCTANFPPSPVRQAPEAAPHAKSILKRDTHSLDEPGAGALANNRSKSLEQREKEYEKVRRRIFSSQDETQWPWLATGPIKVLTPEAGCRNKLLKVQSLEGSGPGCSTGSWRANRGPVSKSHSFGGYAAAEPPHTPRLLSRQGDLASSSWRLSPSSSGYKTLSLRSTDSITPSPTGGASPEPSVNANIPVTANVENAGVVWCVTDMSAVPPGAMVIHPHTGRPLTNPDGSVYQFDPANPPLLYDPTVVQTELQQLDPCSEKRRGRLEKQHSFIDNESECHPNEDCRNKTCCDYRRDDGCQLKNGTDKEISIKPASPPTFATNTQITVAEEPIQQLQQNQPEFELTTTLEPESYEVTNQLAEQYEVINQEAEQYEIANQQAELYEIANQQAERYEVANQQAERFEVANQQAERYEVANQQAERYEVANQQVEAYDVANQQGERYDVTNQQGERYHVANEQPERYEVANQQAENYEVANQKGERYDIANHQTQRYDLANEQPERYEAANQLAEQYEVVNQKGERYNVANHQGERYEVANQHQVYEPPANQKPYVSPRAFEPANQNVVSNGFNNRQVKSVNEGQEIQYQPYHQGYRTDEVTSPPQLSHYVQHEVNIQAQSQQKVQQLPLHHSNIRPMQITNMTNMVYQAPMQPAYNPYQCRVEPSLQMYQQVLQTDEHKLAPSPHSNETAFRIDPSYPYAALDYTSACGACDNNMPSAQQHNMQRSYSVPYGQMEVPQQVLPSYPVGNVMLPQSHIQQLPAYPQYQEQLPWAVPSHGMTQQKLMLPVTTPELYPIMQYQQPAYQHYNIVYPQVIQQPYPICQQVYPVIDNKHQDQRRNSLSNHHSKRNSVSGSARATPSNDDKVNYEDSNRSSEIAAKIQQIKSQMANLDTRDYNRFDREKRGEWRRRNSGSGILGNCPVNNFNQRVIGRGPGDDRHLTTAARAIVDTIRNMQAKTTYHHDNRRDYHSQHPRYEHNNHSNHNNYKYDRTDRPDYRRRDREDRDNARTGEVQERYDARNRVNAPVYRQPYLFRQMAPGTWCRRSPAPIHHPVLNAPRRPYPDARNPRR